MTLSEELQWRGFVQETTLADLKELDQSKGVFYHGFDASADSQTVGNLAAMMMDRVFMRYGYRAILLAGGATSLIGDPGGKDQERPLQDEKTVKQNVERAIDQMKKIFAGYDYHVVNNLDWLKDVNLLPFLRDIGKHFSMTPLVQRDYIAKRLGDDAGGISYTEFSYTLLQGYDYLHLFDRHGCRLQLGGSDQWGNCLSGVELIRRARGETVHAITQPLIINQATGKKFGKSEEGAIWLDEKKTSVYQFYQFWFNTDDESAEKYLKIFTDFDKPAIEVLMAEFMANKGGRIAQRALAYEVTKLVHSKKRADEIVKVIDIIYAGGDFHALARDKMNLLKKELPIGKAVGGDFPQTLVNAGLASSKSQARQFLSSGAVFVNNQKAGPENLDLLVKGNNLVRRGKNQFAIVEK